VPRYRADSAFVTLHARPPPRHTHIVMGETSIAKHDLFAKPADGSGDVSWAIYLARRRRLNFTTRFGRIHERPRGLDVDLPCAAF